MSGEYHLPVMLTETIDLLCIRPGDILVDVTFGGGGHSREILNKIDGKGHLYGLDQDEDAIQNARKEPFASSKNFTFLESNFRNLKRMLRAEGVRPGTVDGILADLGVSSYQFDTAERGFSYRFDGPLDMRMGAHGLTAADILNTHTEEQLLYILSTYGELRNARTFAKALITQRDQKPFKTTEDLKRIAEINCIGDRMRYLSQVFQALRIAVNEEMEALDQFLIESLEMLRPGGRLVIMTYHSLEDRPVKNMLKTGNPQGKVEQDFYGNITRPFQIITKKAIEASQVEQRTNPRSRSAKLRVGEKLRLEK
jgi:16S rRNA (cytosine1402-N4)-methyltransferase